MINIGDRVALKHDGTISNTYIVIARLLRINKPALLKLSRFDGYKGWFSEDKLILIDPARIEETNIEDLFNSDKVVGKVEELRSNVW